MNREILWRVEIHLVLVFQILNRTRDKYLLIKRPKLKLIANKLCLATAIN